MKRTLLLFLLLISLNSFGQQRFVEFQASAGSVISSDRPHPLLLVFPFPFFFNDHCYSLGATYNFKAVDFPFVVSAGTLVSTKRFSKLTTYHVQVPMGFDFQKGKKTQFSAGAGVYGSYLLGYKNKGEPDFERTKQHFQVGLYFKIGAVIPVDERHSIAFQLHQMMDMGRLYSNPLYSPGGGSFGGEHYCASSQLTLALRKYVNP